MVVSVRAVPCTLLVECGASGWFDVSCSVIRAEFEVCQQGLALLALIPIWLYRGRQGYHSKPFQYVCYAFYPVHMLVLVLVLNFVNR